MPLKKLKSGANTEDERPAPIESAGFSKETIAALKHSAERLKVVPARAFSKREIAEVFKKIRDRS
jgi:hypothetical protein